MFQMGTENPVKIAQAAVAHAKDHGNDVVILDTAGRLHIDEDLMTELKNIKNKVEPQEILLVAVSYTHLDVYKRQSHRSTCRMESAPACGMC